MTEDEEHRAIEREYWLMTPLVEKLWIRNRKLNEGNGDIDKLTMEITEIKKEIARISFYWCIDEDGHMDVGQGVF